MCCEWGFSCLPFTGMSMVQVIHKFAEFSHLPAIATGWRTPFSTRKMSTSTTKFWLLKAEPDTRIVKLKNVQVGSRSRYHSDCCISQGRDWTSVVK